MDSESSPSQEPVSQPEHQEKTNPSELFSKAKILAEAAQATYQRDTDKINKAQVADAAEDLLGAASDYAKLDQTSYGKYVDQAEDYLHKQSTSGQPPATTAEQPPAPPPKAQPEARDEEEQPEEGGGSILKMVQSFSKSSSESASGGAGAAEGGDESGGVAGYLKMAGGFFKK